MLAVGVLGCRTGGSQSPTPDLVAATATASPSLPLLPDRILGVALTKWELRGLEPVPGGTKSSLFEAKMLRDLGVPEAEYTSSLGVPAAQSPLVSIGAFRYPGVQEADLRRVSERVLLDQYWHAALHKRKIGSTEYSAITRLNETFYVYVQDDIMLLVETYEPAVAESAIKEWSAGRKTP